MGEVKHPIAQIIERVPSGPWEPLPRTQPPRRVRSQDAFGGGRGRTILRR